jgi:GNAT superfamily N-acetyltransferase
LFTDTTLARRIEGAEARLSEGVVRRVIARRPGSGAFVLPVAEGVAVFGGPQSPFNKVIGAGFEGAPDPDQLAAVERACAERGGAVQAEVATLASPAFHAALTRRGYVAQGFENVLGRPLHVGDDHLTTSAVEVTESTVDEFGCWMDVVVTGFDHPDATGAGSGVPPPPRAVVEEVMGDMAGAPGFRRYVARVGGDLAGGASWRLDESGLAQLTGAATLPAFRRRGVQRALLAARLSAARAAGCDLAVITTQPGTQSQANAQRQGFVLLYARAILVREPGA